jgi:hypothetical protein
MDAKRSVSWGGVVSAAALVCAAGMACGDGPPTVEVPDRMDPFAYPGGNGPMNFVGPGAYPNTVTAKNWEFEYLDNPPILGSINNFRLGGAGGPIAWSASRTNQGDIDITFGLAEPMNPLSSIGDPFWDGQREADGAISLDDGGLPTYGWAPHAARGVMLIEIPKNGQDTGAQVDIGGGIFVPAPEVYAHGGAVANGAERTGRGYDMVTGEWGNLGVVGDIDNNQWGASSSMWFWTCVLGPAQSETSVNMASAWFPYEQGWLGGYATPKGLEFGDVPVNWDFSWLQEYLVDTTTVLTVDENDDLPFGSDLGSTTPDEDADRFGALIEGSFTPDQSGDWAIGGAPDDNFRLQLFIDGEWKTVAFRRGTGGAGDVWSVVNLDGGVSYDVRAWWHERGGGASLNLKANPAADADMDGDIDAPTELITFDAPGADVNLYNLRLYDPTNTSLGSGFYGYYAGAVAAADFPENTLGTGGGIGEWRVEGGARAASESLLDNRETVIWFENPFDPDDTEDRGIFGQAYVEFPADENATNQDGMLFVNNSESSNTPAVATVMEMGDGWIVTNRRDNSFVKGFDEQADSDNMNASNAPFGMVFVDWDTENLIGASVDADGNVIEGRGDFSVTKLEDGRFDIRIGPAGSPKTGDEGMLILQAVGPEPNAPSFAVRAFENYEYQDPDFPDAQEFCVTFRDWEEDTNVLGSEIAVPLQRTGFYFAWVDFTTPMVPPAPDVVCDGDATGDDRVDLEDLLLVLSNFGGGAGGDVTGDQMTDLNDLLLVLSNFGTVCQ